MSPYGITSYDHTHFAILLHPVPIIIHNCSKALRTLCERPSVADKVAGLFCRECVWCIIFVISIIFFEIYEAWLMSFIGHLHIYQCLMLDMNFQTIRQWNYDDVFCVSINILNIVGYLWYDPQYHSELSYDSCPTDQNDYLLCEVISPFIFMTFIPVSLYCITFMVFYMTSIIL